MTKFDEGNSLIFFYNNANAFRIPRRITSHYSEVVFISRWSNVTHEIYITT